MKRETDNIKQVYADRENDKKLLKNHQGTYPHYISEERERAYKLIINKRFPNIENLKLLEVGAGVGVNLTFFHSIGFQYSNMFANELLEDRFEKLKNNFPQVNCILGDATEIKLDQKFDIVFQSTVFSSILSNELRTRLAAKMFDLTNDSGIVLWYDFVYNNPQNKNVRKVEMDEIKSLFPNAKRFEFYKVTLAPPIGRRVGAWYAFFNKFSFLRTHIIAVIHK